MIQTVEAIIDAQGNVHLLQPVKVSGERRALVTILDEVPAIENGSDKDAKYPLRGTPIQFIDPTKPVAVEEWEALQ
jgi:hypothetical protein